MDIIRATVEAPSGPPSVYDVTVTIRVRAANTATQALIGVIDFIAQALDGT